MLIPSSRYPPKYQPNITRVSLKYRPGMRCDIIFMDAGIHCGGSLQSVVVSVFTKIICFEASAECLLQKRVAKHSTHRLEFFAPFRWLATASIAFGRKRMAGGTSGSADLLPHIQLFLRQALHDLSTGAQITVSIPVYKPREYPLETNTNCLTIFEETTRHEEISSKSGGGSLRLVAMIRVLEIAEGLLQQNRRATKRDMYYTDPALFKGRIDQSINDICSLFHCSRSSLNLVASSKGLVSGQLCYFEEGRLINCSKRNSTSNGLPVPVRMNEVSNISSDAEFILVVEKETVFHRLTNDKFCAKNRCILITGKGYPDVATRSFLRRLVDELHLPVYGLMDGDPYGLDILSVYRFGSLTMAYDAEVLAVPTIRWLGIFLSDLSTYDLPESCLLQLSKLDVKKADTLLSRSYLQHLAPIWWAKLAEFRYQGVKLEIEAVSAASFSLLADQYIPSKIHGQYYI